MSRKKITLNINNKLYEMEIAPNRILADLLREDLGLTGTKKSCEIGVCGSCTVLLDGAAVNSCLILAVDCEGKKITTIEGVSQNEKLDRLQESFVDTGAVQCGFCTPGMILSAKALLTVNPKPTEFEIRKAIAGNLCRCTGYAKIVEAIKSASG
ncbi:MAG: (2Fe-2S)-binding protein [Actinobacteria bacterium]|nr:(2Fe-2S)-binding protein [Actinomycetota bacterium]MBM3710732.1 (2Fe-2S)-binding protein [Actinomycetota bacterium]